MSDRGGKLYHEKTLIARLQHVRLSVIIPQRSEITNTMPLYALFELTIVRLSNRHSF